MNNSTTLTPSLLSPLSSQNSGNFVYIPQARDWIILYVVDTFGASCPIPLGHL